MDETVGQARQWRSYSHDPQWAAALEWSIAFGGKHLRRVWVWLDAVAALAVARWCLAHRRGIPVEAVTPQALADLLPVMRRTSIDAPKIFRELIAEISDPTDPAVRMWTQRLGVDVTSPATGSDARLGMAVAQGAYAAWAALRRAYQIPERGLIPGESAREQRPILLLCCAVCGREELGLPEDLQDARARGWVSGASRVNLGVGVSNPTSRPRTVPGRRDEFLPLMALQPAVQLRTEGMGTVPQAGRRTHRHRSKPLGATPTPSRGMA